ncbi:MAG: ATP-binding protein [Spirochaetes bacterium]|nr:ATP-binding protein [Spirochaetota bacterium]
MIPRQISYPSNNSFFLLGPRGTGKSQFTRQAFAQAIFFDLLEDELFRTLLANPQQLDGMIPKRHAGWVVIDEIQKIPALLDEIHRLIEKRGMRFVLTGSSTRKLRRSGVNLLAGRAFIKRAYPLTALELGNAFNLKKALQRGLLPRAYLKDDYHEYLNAYVAAYLREEVQQEGFVQNLGSFARFLEAAAFSQAQVVNVSKVAADCSVERKTVANFFQILDDLLLAHFLDVFSLRAKRRLLKSRKFYFFDAGVFKTIRPRGPLDIDSELNGQALETIVLQELTARNEYQALGYKLYFWHTQTHIEVDFILYGERGIKAIEVKSSARLRDDDFHGLSEFKKDYPQAELFMLYGGTSARFQHSVQVLPIADFLQDALRWI